MHEHTKDLLAESDSGASDIIKSTLGLSETEEFDVRNPLVTDAPAVPYLVVPSGRRIESLKPIIDQFKPKPDRRTGTAVLSSSQSFIDHVVRFKSESTVIFAERDITKPSLLAVYDYHPKGGDVTLAAFGGHRAKYSFPVSPEWKAWNDNEEKELDATAFGRFLEDRIQDVVAIDTENTGEALRELIALIGGGTFASPSQLLDLSRSLTINAAVSVKQAQTLSSGEIAVSYTEVHNDGEGRPIKVPNLFAIGIPIFRDGHKYRIVCRLRYKLQDRQWVKWWYSLVNPDLYFDDAFKEVCDEVASTTELPVLFGAPES